MTEFRTGRTAGKQPKGGRHLLVQIRVKTVDALLNQKVATTFWLLRDELPLKRLIKRVAKFIGPGRSGLESERTYWRGLRRERRRGSREVWCSNRNDLLG